MYSFKSIGAKSRSVSEIGFTINFGVVRIKEELGNLLDGWQVEKLELDMRGYTCDYE